MQGLDELECPFTTKLMNILSELPTICTMQSLVSFALAQSIHDFWCLDALWRHVWGSVGTPEKCQLLFDGLPCRDGFRHAQLPRSFPCNEAGVGSHSIPSI